MIQGTGDGGSIRWKRKAPALSSWGFQKRWIDLEANADRDAVRPRRLIRILAEPLTEERSLLPVRVQRGTLCRVLSLRALDRCVGERVERFQSGAAGARRTDGRVELAAHEIVHLRVIEGVDHLSLDEQRAVPDDRQLVIQREIGREDRGSPERAARAEEVVVRRTEL